MNRDLYEHLTTYADDATILNMLRVNKKYSDQEFFEKVLKRRYPLLEKFQKPEETKKELYLRMMYFIGKLKEKYDIDYEPIESFNPQEFYYLLRLVKEMLYRLKNLPKRIPNDEGSFLDINFISGDNQNPRKRTGFIQIFVLDNNQIIVTKYDNFQNVLFEERMEKVPSIKYISKLLLNQKVATLDLFHDADGILQFIVTGVYLSLDDDA